MTIHYDDPGEASKPSIRELERIEAHYRAESDEVPPRVELLVRMALRPHRSEKE